MKLQLKEMTSAMNSLTNMVNQFVGAVVSAPRCDVYGWKATSTHWTPEGPSRRKEHISARAVSGNAETEMTAMRAHQTMRQCTRNSICRTFDYIF